MSEGGALINLGELSKPAVVLIEKISDALGGIFRPYQIRRIADAEAKADEIRAVSQIKINDLQRRAVKRFMIEEAKKQHNIEEITRKALPEVQEGANPKNIEDDWITNFFDKCRLISDDEMQTLWSKVLAGEANRPGKYSKRTVNQLSSLDKVDAHLFRNLCSFTWQIGDLIPLIFNTNDKIYNDAAVNFSTLKHLDEIGLLSFESTGYERQGIPQTLEVRFYETRYELSFSRPENNVLPVGNVLLSRVGQELAPICGSSPCPGFQDYAIKSWRDMGIIGFSIKEVT